MKEFFLKKLIKSKVPEVNEADVDKMLGIFNQNPELFKKIAEEIKEKVDGGSDQMTATFEVMEKYQDKLKDLNK